MHLPPDDLWALAPTAFDSILPRLSGLHAASLPDPDELGSAAPISRVAQAAIIPVVGLLTKWTIPELTGTAYTSIQAQLHAAIQHPQVREIILLIDSPGGSTSGVADTADDIAAAHRIKPVTAFVDDVCCSAAYFLASQAGTIVANRSATIGSVGTLHAVLDTSALAERSGVKVHVFKSGRYKGAGVPGTPLTADQAEMIQRRVNAFQAMFESAVVQKRRLNPQQLDAIFNADVFVGQAAVHAGLADKVGRLMLNEAAATAARYEAEARSRQQQQRDAADCAARAESKRNRYRYY